MKTNRTFKITAVTFALALTSSIAGAQPKKHEEKFCSSLTSLNQDLTKLKEMGPSSTVGELKASLRSAKKHSEEVGKEARKMKSPEAKQFTEAANQLTSRSNISDDMTIQQAKSQIQDDVQNLEQHAQALAQESGCPGAMPQRGAGGTQREPGGATPQPQTPPTK
ncbi:MAG: hypothetical protein HOV81_00215 [Kofleriaceae bacterium]|nr:hypothetical protein [Kofleriaceae bacterium]